jgi:uncharacterized DUF497 family protein
MYISLRTAIGSNIFKRVHIKVIGIRRKDGIRVILVRTATQADSTNDFYPGLIIEA